MKRSKQDKTQRRDAYAKAAEDAVKPGPDSTTVLTVVIMIQIQTKDTTVSHVVRTAVKRSSRRHMTVLKIYESMGNER